MEGAFSSEDKKKIQQEREKHWVDVQKKVHNKFFSSNIRLIDSSLYSQILFLC